MLTLGFGESLDSSQVEVNRFSEIYSTVNMRAEYRYEYGILQKSLGAMSDSQGLREDEVASLNKFIYEIAQDGTFEPMPDQLYTQNVWQVDRFNCSEDGDNHKYGLMRQSTGVTGVKVGG